MYLHLHEWEGGVSERGQECGDGFIEGVAEERFLCGKSRHDVLQSPPRLLEPLREERERESVSRIMGCLSSCCLPDEP